MPAFNDSPGPEWYEAPDLIDEGQHEGDYEASLYDEDDDSDDNEYQPYDDPEFGPDSATQTLERGRG